MAVKFTKMKLISKKTGEVKEVSFPMAAGLLNALSPLPKEEQSKFLVREYYEYKHEQKRMRKALSLETMLEDCTEFDDELIDDSLSPEEQCLRNERDAMLYDAIEKLNERQRKSHCRAFCHDRSQTELLEEMRLPSTTRR